MKTLLFLGDSITDCNHYFDPENLGYGYVRMISEQINTPDKNYQVLNKGNDGFTVPSVRRLWKRSCLNLKPDFITILIGINDLAVIKNTGITLSVGLAEFREQYQALIDDIRMMTDSSILLMEPFIFPWPAEYTAWEEDLHTLSNLIQELAVKNTLSFLPLWDELRTTAKSEGYSEITTDGIHLTPNGHKLIASKWLETASMLVSSSGLK